MQYGRLNLNLQNRLSARAFVKNEDNFFEKDFNRIIELCIYAHSKMLENENNLDGLGEETLRNILMGYIQLNRGLYRLGRYVIDAESAEINNHITQGYCDLKITIPTNDDWSNEPLNYYIIECKRLNGESQKNDLYITEGIHRFISEKYSRKMNIGGMIGFIETNQNKQINNQCNVPSLVENINNKLINKYKHNDNEKLTVTVIQLGFFDSFESKHKVKNRNNERSIKLIHLFLDNRNQGSKTLFKKLFA